MNKFLMISPNYDVSKLAIPTTIDSLIDVYEDRIRFWTIEPARIISQYPHGGFAVCHLLASYFESYAIYFKGKDSEKKSFDFFSMGLFSVFPELKFQTYTKNQLDEFISIMYKSFRCGLYHIGLAREKIMLVNGDDALNIITNVENQIITVQIDTSKLISSIENHFNKYICDLRNVNNIETRKNFRKSMELLFFNE